jgi:hypothetical protein
MLTNILEARGFLQPRLLMVDFQDQLVLWFPVLRLMVST